MVEHVTPQSNPSPADLVPIYQAKGPDAVAWQDVSHSDYLKAKANNFDTRVVYTTASNPGATLPDDRLHAHKAPTILHTCYGVYYDGSTGNKPGWITGGLGPSQFGKPQAERAAFLPGYKVKRLALIEYPEDGVPAQAPRKSDGWCSTWKQEGFNGSLRVAAEALSFLAENPRPAYGEARFNSEHCHQLASELRITMRELLAPAVAEKGVH